MNESAVYYLILEHKMCIVCWCNAQMSIFLRGFNGECTKHLVNKFYFFSLTLEDVSLINILYIT